MQNDRSGIFGMDKEQQGKIDRLFWELFVPGEGEAHLDFATPGGQRYLIPSGSIHMGLSLYHPSRMRGKFVKRFLPYMRRSSFLLARIGARKTALRVSDALHALLSDAFGRKDLELAVFCGTPGVHRKITVQVSAGGRVLGYAKISDREEVKALFAREHTLLNRLRNAGLENIPRILFCGELTPGTGIFIQDTAEREKQLRGRDTEPLVWDFLSELHAKTAADIPFGKSGYYHDLQRLKAGLPEFGEKEARWLERAADEVETFFHLRETLFSIYHGDLTPWNTFIHRGRLYAFDWEYARDSYPPYLDFFHFFTRRAFYEGQWNAGKTIRKFEENQSGMKKYIPDPRMYYKAYLLAAIGFYTARDKKEAFSPACRFWLDLLNELNDTP